MKNGMTAKKLRVVLVIVMLLSAGATIGGFLYIQHSLSGYAQAISKLNADAASGDESIQILRKLEARLSSEQSTIDKAKSVVTDNATFTDKAIDDISDIAARSGVRIVSYEFSSTTPAVAPAPAGAAAQTPATTAPTTPAATPIPGGVTKRTVTVAIETPLDYTNLMNFIKNIETNELKMQIPNITMSKATGNQVATQTFLIEVYVR